VIEALANRSGARNLGIQHSSSDGILLIDSDMVLSGSLISECKSTLTEHGALVIPEVSVGRGFWVECKALEREANAGVDFLEAARCFRRNILISLGGVYNPRFEAGEDWDLQNRVKAMGISFGRTKAKIIHDEGEANLMRFLKKKFFYGRNLRSYLRENSITGTKQINPLYRILLPSIKVIPSDPAHGAGIFVLKTMELIVGGVGFIIGPTQLTPGV
jgi:arabinofuranan 3-O-arabinosyltransferase